jgi:hypothetical protein
LTPISGFILETVSAEEEKIDVSTAVILLTATEVATATPASVRIESVNPSINIKTQI